MLRGVRLPFIMLLSCTGWLTAALAGAPPPVLPSMPVPGSGERVLIVAPHPDDETLCCGGLIQLALRRGAEVAVVWITDGDGFEIDAMLVERSLRPRGAGLLRLGAQRMSEARAAATRLGVHAMRQYFLGYPDRGVAALTGDFYRRDYQSVYTGASAVPYVGAWHTGNAYTGENLERDLAQVIEAFAPTLVLAAAPQDMHSDHAASGALALRLLQRRGQASRLRYWIVHAGRHWPEPRHYHPQLTLSPPAIASRLEWQSVALDRTAVGGKLIAIRQQRSQTEVMAPFLLAFVRANELFALPIVPTLGNDAGVTGR